MTQNTLNLEDVFCENLLDIFARATVIFYYNEYLSPLSNLFPTSDFSIQESAFN